MLIAHEAPLSIFDLVDSKTDYNYALVHLFEENEDYLKKFENLIKQGREVILDNSIFELGSAFESDKFAYWVERLKPEWYVVPDSLENYEETVSQFCDWCSNYNHLPGKKIGVVQGRTYNEIVDCYNQLINHVDKLAISFDYSMFEEWYPNEKTKYHQWMKGRIKLINMLLADNVIDTSIPHHLLGCGLPQEFLYHKHHRWIHSLDTSNPIVHGMFNIKYDHTGLENKKSIKLCDMITHDLNQHQLECVKHNIDIFRGFCK